MIEVIVLENIQHASAVNYELLITAVIAFISALIIWLIKLSIDNFLKESVALTEIQIALAVNAEKIKDNEEFYDQWLHALSVNKLYSTQFHSLLFPYDKLRDIKSFKLVNQVIFTFYMCESFGKDLNGIHKSYYDIGTSGVFKDLTDENWFIFNKSTHSSALKNKASFKTISERILEDVAETKRYIEIRKKSFHYVLISTFKGSSVSKFEDAK
jgi:hypothetical protein